MEIDPRKFIAGPFGRCPNCGGPEYGTLMVSNNRHTRRCRRCWHTQTEALPLLQKRVVYVDQMALSNMAKELDPEWRERVSRSDPFWLELYDQLERLVKLQVLVLPLSPIHERESSFDDRVESVLRRLYGHLSGDVSFDFPEQVRSRQIYQAQQAYMKGEVPDWTDLDPRSVTHGRLDEWTDRMSIHVNMGHLETVEERREQREKVGAVMEQLWERWREEKVDFDTAYQRERRGIAQASVQATQEHLRLHANAAYDALPDDPLDLIPGTLAQLFMAVNSRFADAGASPEQALEQTMEFLHDDAALSAPQNELSSILYAALARRATNGQKRPPNRGTPNDIDAISSYLPYCEAIFVDNEMAQLLSEEPLASEVAKYGTRVFSTRTRDEFLAYLRQIEAETPPEHVELVRRTYGDSWLTGFRTILEHERAAEQRREASS
jgi:hypothetical protein